MTRSEERGAMSMQNQLQHQQEPQGDPQQSPSTESLSPQQQQQERRQNFNRQFQFWNQQQLQHQQKLQHQQQQQQQQYRRQQQHQEPQPPAEPQETPLPATRAQARPQAEQPSFRYQEQQQQQHLHGCQRDEGGAAAVLPDGTTTPTDNPAPAPAPIPNPPRSESHQHPSLSGAEAPEDRRYQVELRSGDVAAAAAVAAAAEKEEQKESNGTPHVHWQGGTKSPNSCSGAAATGTSTAAASGDTEDLLSPFDFALFFEDDDYDGKHQKSDAERQQNASIRVASTLLLSLLMPAAILSFAAAAPQHRLVVAVAWAVVGLLFVGFVQFLRHVVRNPIVLHPAIHKLVGAVAQEYRDFVADWREQILAITDGSGTDGPADGDVGDDVAASEKQQHGQEAEEKPKRRSPKSFVFRAVVQPFVPWLQRRRQKRQAKKRSKQKQKQKGKPVEEFQPASPEMELV